LADVWWGSLTHAAGYRGAVVGLDGGCASVGVDAEPHDVLPDGVPLTSLSAYRLSATGYSFSARLHHWTESLFWRQRSNVQGLVSA